MNTDELVLKHISGAVGQFIDLLDNARFAEAFVFAQKEIKLGYDEMLFYKCWAQMLTSISNPLNAPSDSALISLRDEAISTLSKDKTNVDIYTAIWIAVSAESLLDEQEEFSLLSDEDERVSISIMNISLTKDVKDGESFYKAFATRLNSFGQVLAKRREYWLSTSSKIN